jgi:hypothetical protein
MWQLQTTPSAFQCVIHLCEMHNPNLCVLGQLAYALPPSSGMCPHARGARLPEHSVSHSHFVNAKVTLRS